MKGIDPLFAYLTILAVIQPARIQDIEANADDLLNSELANFLIENGLLRIAHQTARANKYVIQVRRGVYFTAPLAKSIVRRAGLEKSIDNSRLFLMKAQRKKYR